MQFSYKTVGTCSSRINFTIEDGIVKGVTFYQGCDGNLQGIGRLVEGKPAEEVIELLSGIKCGYKPTSCPDQLARSLRQALSSKHAEASAEQL
ncbi:MAG: TIGR03905 family TSCPD domain-containing protein [Eubacteriaceae bacterium]|nr:TIGR03905 family TSCPD domain-containing protein [Eubacteriaceae bacterium]